MLAFFWAQTVEGRLGLLPYSRKIIGLIPGVKLMLVQSVFICGPVMDMRTIQKDVTQTSPDHCCDCPPPTPRAAEND